MSHLQSGFLSISTAHRRPDVCLQVMAEKGRGREREWEREAAGREHDHLLKTLSPFDGVCVILSIMIGSGIFASPGPCPCLTSLT